MLNKEKLKALSNLLLDLKLEQKFMQLRITLFELQEEYIECFELIMT